MRPAPRRGLTRRDQLVVAGMALIGVLTAAPGVHLFEVFLRPWPALLVSHAIAVVLLCIAAYHWRVRRARAPGRSSTAG